MSAPDLAQSTWAPLRIGLFRALFLAVLVSNIGAWMQTVGAQWLLVHQPHSSLLVSLVQAADTLPDLMFALAGGVLADTLDRRMLLLMVQAFLVLVGVALTVLTFANQMPPALLLTFTFLMGAGSAFSAPAYQAVIPELVPRDQVRSASALGAISVNLARAVGPAIAGVLIARIGVGAVFALNTATFLVFLVIVAGARFPAGSAPQFPERFVPALRAGTRYVRFAPVVRRILLRASLFLIPASALWALLPVVASQHLGQSSTGYGVLLAALGAGAILGAFVLPHLRRSMSDNTLLLISSVVYAAVLVGLVTARAEALEVVILIPAGVAWMAVLSSINAGLQLFLPAWVRARGLSIYQMVLFGAQGIGAVLWGFVAEPLGLVATFLLAAGLLVVGAATIRMWPFADTSGMDRRLVSYWPAPRLVMEPELDSGPVLVQNTFTIAPEKADTFLQTMDHVRLSRLRTGATRWGLFRDGEEPRRFVEVFVVPSWEEHLRQHADRQTGTDRAYEEEAIMLSDPPPTTAHLLTADLRD